MAANPFMMDDPVGGSSESSANIINPFGASAGSAASAVNPFFDVGGPVSTSGMSGTSNPFLMGGDDEMLHQPSMITTGMAFNPFAAVDPSAGGGHDGLAWLSSGGAMRHDASPYDLPDSSAAAHQHGGLVDDLLEEDVPLPEELITNMGTVEVATPSPQASPIPSEASMMKPTRPTPPPRPPSRPSPPHETQKLILSVTGAMQATSDHLLDRLRAAAPSPVPGYHPPVPSHTPSPSPSPSHSPTPPHHPEMDLLHEEVPHGHPPPRPTSRPTSPAVPQRPPSRPGAPPRPAAAPPIVPASVPHVPPAAEAKPGGFASIFGAPSPTAELDALALAAEQRQAAAASEEPAEEIDLLGLPKPRTRTKNDILKLFDKKEEKEKDLLAGDVFDSPFSMGNAPDHVGDAVLGGYSMAPDVITTTSATFYQQAEHENTMAAGPFDSHQDVVPNAGAPIPSQPVYPEIRSPVYVQSDPIAIPDRSGVAGQQHDEEFDAFSSRFESVGREDTLMVESDPFDPFSAGGSAKGSSGKDFS